MMLRLSAPGASEDEGKCGLAAAMQVFQATGVSPIAAAEGMFALEGWDDSGFPADGLTEAEAEAAEVWMQAENAAIETCCAGWPEEKRPDTMGHLELVSSE